MKHRRPHFIALIALILLSAGVFWRWNFHERRSDSIALPPRKAVAPAISPATPSRLAARVQGAGIPAIAPGPVAAVAAVGAAPVALAGPAPESLAQFDEAVVTHSFAEWGGRKIHPTRILARMAQDMDLRADDVLLRSLNLTIRHRYSSADGLVLLDSADGVTPRIEGKEEAVARGEEQIRRIKLLNGSGLFRYAEPDWIVHMLIEPTDSAYTDGTLWGLKNTGQNFGTPGADIGITNSGASSNAWDITTGSTNVIVAIIDTGIRYTHFDLTANVWHDPTNSAIVGINAVLGTSDPYDDNNHGTHVSGTIGAAANNGQAHVGINWSVQLMACKFLDATGSGATSDAIKCIDFAVSKRARVMNNSWGGGGFSQSLLDAILNARNRGVLFVAAAGNDGQNTDQFPGYPSCYDADNVVAVAALDRTDHLASFSNYGQRTVKLGAPGVSIFSSTAGSDGEYRTFDGTSMACPHVTGVAALILARYPNIDLVELKQRLISSVVPVADLAGKSATGGRVNAFNALTAAADGILEVSVTVPNGMPLQGGALVPIYAAVTDLSPITNATVTASGFTNLTFQNDGLNPDGLANDNIYSALVLTPRNTNSFSLTFVVTAPGKTNYTNTTTFSVLLPPANDDFTNRVLLPLGTTNAAGSNVGATKEAGEPNHAGALGGKSVWWSWTPATNATYTIDTLGSQFDTLLAIYTGSTVSNLTMVAADDDSGGGGASAITFNAIAGTPYQMAVDGYGGASGGVSLNLAQTPPSSPRIIKQPADKTAVPGDFVSFSVSVDGSFPLSYQWSFQGSAVLGATNSIFTINSVATNDAGIYSVVVSNSLGGATSSNATLRVPLLGNGFYDDFEPDIHSTNWSSFGGTVLANKFGGSVSGINSLWFGGDGSRFAVTRPVNTSFGGTISFSIRLSDGASYPWENVDLPEEGVVFQYSIDAGSNWINIATYDTGAYHNWTDQQTTIPSRALGTNVLFRWIQPRNSGNYYDHWALDDVLFSASSTPHAPVIIASPADQAVSVGGAAVFSLVVDGTPPLAYQWRFNGDDLPNQTNATLKLANVSTNQVGIYSVAVSNFQGSALSGGARLILIPTLGEALNIPWLTWRTGGNAPWIVETNTTHDGVIAAQSGTIFSSGNPLYNQESWVETTVTGPGVVTFWWKVSSEGCFPPANFGEPCDTLNFIVYSNAFDQITVDFMQGESNWVYRSFLVGPGQQNLRWSYKKDPYFDVGQDRGWLDEVRFTPTSPAPPFTFNGPRRLASGPFQFNFSGDLGRNYQIESSTNLIDWLPYANFTATNLPMLFLDVTTNIPRRFYRGKNVP